MPRPALRIVLPRYGEEVTGGTETLVRRLVAALAAREWAVEVWTTTAVAESTWIGDYAPGVVEAGNARIRRFPVRRARRPAAFHQFSRAMFRLPPLARPERTWLRAQGPYAPALVRALTTADSRPTLFTPYLYHPIVYGLPAAPHPRVLMPAAHDERPLRLRSVARLVAAADALWYHSVEERELLERAHPIARTLPAAVGTTGVDPPASAQPERFRAQHGVSGPYLLYGGRTAAGKGVEVLLDGYQQLRRRHPEVTLVVAGESDIGVADDGVVRAGRLPDAAWSDALAGAAAVVVPSSHESLSLLALEAWAAGRPVLLNAESAVLAAHARRSRGALTFTGATELAREAARLLDDATLAGRLGSAGAAYVAAEYRWDDVVETLRRLIAVAGRSRR